MAKMTAKQLAAWERKRNLNVELREAVEEATRGRWARKTEFFQLGDGRLRRRVTRNGGTIEHNEIIAAGRIRVAAARAGTGLS
jgi:hypothetical protein